MRILLVEDNDKLRDRIANILKKEQYTVSSAESAEEGMYIAQEYDIDIGIFDLNLPRMSGLDLIQKLRKNDSKFPIIVLSAKSNWNTKVESLDAGADDYVTKPFSTEELLSRIKALLRRTTTSTTNSIANGELEIDLDSKVASIQGNILKLTSYEYRILQYMMMHTDKIISKYRLMDMLYQDDDEKYSNTIEVFIRKLRMKLAKYSPNNFIETFRGQGYRLNKQENN